MAVVVKSLLNALKTEIEAKGKKLLIVHIPPGDDFGSGISTINFNLIT